ncbi:MAG: hypothetical protein H8D24_01300 [Gammaproteobacteria bacterium]|uniref:Metal-dependent peptidase n=1 Tax=Candidatus Thiopontia autotrophica TaxID=2841688 RepID=A0A8J6TPT2_9GAMM|nr:hypothetical protein [Candidatus Thiopontia autotrophica]MBL6969374.1 hypothetical protein [Gammaproteobacteria bacterium]
MSEVVDTKLSAARTRLILERPFLGALVLRLPLVEASPGWCKTTATDARSIYYNAEYISALTSKQVQFMLAHDALHCALSHFSRRQHRNRHRWDVACDFAINAMLIGEDMVPPDDVLYLKSFDGMTAEEIYPMLDEDDDRETLDQHLYDNHDDTSDSSDSELDASDAHGSGTPNSGWGYSGASGRPPPLGEMERNSLETQWQQHLAGAAQQAMQAGKLDGAMARMVDHFLQPRLPWRMMLAHYMTARARDDYSYLRPSSRRGSGAIFPSLRSGQLDVVVAIDTSGSVSIDEIGEFVSEINGLKGQIRAGVTLLMSDQEIVGEPVRFEPWEPMEVQSELIKGGRGTSFNPVFRWLEQQDSQPDILLYFTDAEGKFPADPPQLPVIWLIKGRGCVPWGERIQLN